MKLVLFALLPLILSMGITPVLSFDLIPEADALKSKGTALPETGSKKVCGDRLCSESEVEKQLPVPEESTSVTKESTEVAGESVSIPEKSTEVTGESVSIPEKSTEVTGDSAVTVPGNVVYYNGLYQLVEISENIYSFGNSIYLSMILITDEGVIAVDPISAEHSEEMLQAIKAVTDQPVKYLIYSHNHWDHTLGGQNFKDDGATILSHVDARDWFLDNPNPDVVVPDEAWEGNQKSMVLGDTTLELYQFGPSHGKGMTVFYFPDEKIVFVGDLVTPHTVGFATLADFVPSEWERTLIEVEKLDFDIAMYSHKQFYGPASEVTEQREYLQDLRIEIARMVEEGVYPITIPSTIELPKYQDWGAYDNWLELNAWRVLFEIWIGW